MFGNGGTAMFIVDDLKMVGASYAGSRLEGLVVQFPKDTPYLLVARDLTTPMSIEDLVVQRKEEEASWKALEGEDASISPSPTAALDDLVESAVGQYL